MFWSRNKEMIDPPKKSLWDRFKGRSEPQGPSPQQAWEDKLASLPRPVAAGGMDSYAKAGFASDGSMPDALLGFYTSTGFIGHQLCAYLSQNWLINKACSMPARDAIRKGWDVVADNGDKLPSDLAYRFRKADERYRIASAMEEFVRFGRIYGVRVAFPMIESSDPKFYEYPFNPDGILPGTYKGMVQVDPQWCSPEMDTASAMNPASLHFYEPTYWNINGRRFHRSHLIIYRHGGGVPDILKPQYRYGGIPVPQLIMERVYNAERTANEAPQIAMTKRLNTFGTDMAEAMANGGLLKERLAELAKYRDNYSVLLHDKDGDSVQQFDTGLADLDAVVMTQYQLVAAAAEVPATKLIGTTPKGFNATGEYEESSYHEMLESIQSSDLNPFIERHMVCAMRSDIGPKIGEIIPTSVKWAPLDTPTAKELADTQLVKAQTDQVLQATGGIDGDDIRQRIRSDEDSGYYGIEDAPQDSPIEE